MIAAASTLTAPIGRMFAGLLLLSMILASFDATADVTTGSAEKLGQNTHTQRDMEPDEHLLAQFRAAPLSLTQAIAIAERSHLGSRTAAATFEISDKPGYRVRTVRNKQIWENVVDVTTGRTIGLETSLSMSDLDVDERDNIMQLKSVGQELSDAVA